jgi:hypothetical protein
MDTIAGRYVTTRTTRDGDAEMLVAPTNPHDLASKLLQAHSSLGR